MIPQEMILWVFVNYCNMYKIHIIVHVCDYCRGCFWRICELLVTHDGIHRIVMFVNTAEINLADLLTAKHVIGFAE